MATRSTEPGLVIRGPSVLPAKPDTDFAPPSIEFLQGLWYVTHSTLPMWKSNKNITITYTPLGSPPGAIDDFVQYKPLDSDKEKTVHGIDTPDPDVQAKYSWRGKGLLKVTSSEWEVLGFGNDEGGWAVTYFAKTLFTPAGIDVYARTQYGISTSLLDRIKHELKKVDDDDFRAMLDGIFEIKHE